MDRLWYCQMGAAQHLECNVLRHHSCNSPNLRYIMMCYYHNNIIIIIASATDQRSSTEMSLICMKTRTRLHWTLAWTRGIWKTKSNPSSLISYPTNHCWDHYNPTEASHSQIFDFSPTQRSETGIPSFVLFRLCNAARLEFLVILSLKHSFECQSVC